MISRHPDCLRDRNILSGLLHDTFPNEKLDTNLLLMAYDIGIAAIAAQCDEVDTVLLRFLKNRLMDSYGIREDHALRAVVAWFAAFGREVPDDGTEGEVQTGIAPTKRLAVAPQPIRSHPANGQGRETTVSMRCTGRTGNAAWSMTCEGHFPESVGTGWNLGIGLGGMTAFLDELNAMHRRMHDLLRHTLDIW